MNSTNPVSSLGLSYHHHCFQYFLEITFKSSRPEVFCKKGVLRNFTKSTGKHLCQSLFFNKVAGLKPATLLKKRLWHRFFPVNFTKFLRTPFLIEIQCFIKSLNFMLDEGILQGVEVVIDQTDFMEISEVVIF